MKRQNIFILINLALFFTMLNQNNIVIATSYNPPIITEDKEIIGKRQNQEIKEKKKKKNDIIYIKKQIQDRRKLHKNLLNSYNQNFDSNTLHQITNNSIQIELLEGFKNTLIKKRT